MSTDDTRDEADDPALAGSPADDGEGAPPQKVRIGTRVERGREAFEDLRSRSPLVDTSARIALRPRYTLDTIASGYIALRIFVLLFPLAYVIVAGIGLTASHDGATGDDVTSVTGLTGALADSVASAANGSQRGHWVIIIIGTGTALWAARSLLKALRISHAIAWRLPDAKYRPVEFAPVLVVGGIIVAAWLGSVATRVRHENGAPTLVAFLTFGGVIGIIWFFASRALPHARCSWWFHVPGAVLVGLATVSLNLAVTVYFVPKLNHASQTYGALGVGLVLITYLLMVGWIIVLSAELNAGIFETVSVSRRALDGRDRRGALRPLSSWRCRGGGDNPNSDDGSSERGSAAHPGPRCGAGAVVMSGLGRRARRDARR